MVIGGWERIKWGKGEVMSPTWARNGLESVEKRREKKERK